MNVRVLLHVIGVVAAAIAGGTVAFAGIGEMIQQNVVTVAFIVSLATNAYLGLTTSGVSLPIRKGN